MSNVTRVYVKVRDLKDPKDELTIALSKFKKKIKETGILTEYLESRHFRRPAVRRKDKAEKALRRSRRLKRQQNPQH